MNSTQTKPTTVTQYIAQCPPDVQPSLHTLRAAILKAAPKAVERISYGMPFYEYGGKGYEGRLIYFAAFKKHISIFITPRHSEYVPDDLQAYHISKATYQFPLSKPIPYSLVEKAVRQLVKAREAGLSGSRSGKSSKKDTQNISPDILAYHHKLSASDQEISFILMQEISKGLPEAENKVWHGHPVWFLKGNPIVGYSKQKAGIRLMFWSGAGFEEEGLPVRGNKFKDASVFYQSASDIHPKDLKRWLKKSITIQWDYKNIVKRKGVLVRLQ